MLHGDSHSESVLTDIGADPLLNARNLNVESLFEYGSRVGFWEIMRVHPRARDRCHGVCRWDGARAQSRARRGDCRKRA